MPMVGVAKPTFARATHAVAVLREISARPVFVTAGMPCADAAGLVRRMARQVPGAQALRRADLLARAGPLAALQESHHLGL